MNTVIIYGDKKNNLLKNNLIRILKENNSIHIFEDNSIISDGIGESINLIFTNNLKLINVKNAIIIIGINAKVHNIKYINRSSKIIVNANDSKQIMKLSKMSTKIYTCGFSSKDYVTFSSRNNDTAVVSLQRSVQLSKTEYCEPFEIPCIIENEISDYFILSSVLSLILLKNLNENISCELTKIYFS